MKLHHGLCFGLLSVLVCADHLPAQTDRPLDDVPLEVRSADHLSDVQRQEVQQYISGWIKILADSTNPVQQGMARDKLTSGVTPVGTEAVGTDYQNVYSQILNDALLPLLKNSEMRVRLLAGIVAGRVGEHTGNVALVPTAMALLDDKSDAVLIWGMRAGRYVLPTLLRAGVANSPLGPQMAKTLGMHPEIPLANDAYDAADLSTETNGAALLAAAQQTILLLRTRAQVFVKATPVDASADSIGTTFLSIAAWGILPPDQKLEAIQQISDLVSVMAQRGQADGEQMPRILAGMQFVAKAIYVIGTAEHADDVVNAAKPVAEQHFSSQTPPQDIVALVRKIYPALIAFPEFAKLKAPPTIQTPPTTQPAELNH